VHSCIRSSVLRHDYAGCIFGYRKHTRYGYNGIMTNHPKASSVKSKTRAVAGSKSVKKATARARKKANGISLLVWYVTLGTLGVLAITAVFVAAYTSLRMAALLAGDTTVLLGMPGGKGVDADAGILLMWFLASLAASTLLLGANVVAGLAYLAFRRPSLMHRCIVSAWVVVCVVGIAYGLYGYSMR
jgi:hypothetical protein